jgi:hypothetical protein
MRNGIAYRLPPLVHRTSAIESSWLPTPAANEPGMKAERLVDKDGNRPTHMKQRLYDKDTGRLCQKGLTQFVAMFPTPTARDYRSGKGKTQAERGRSAGPSLAEVSGGSLNPMWVEWLMGFPEGWTDCEDSETQ